MKALNVNASKGVPKVAALRNSPRRCTLHRAPVGPDGDSTDVAPALPTTSGTTSDAPRTNNRTHSVTSSTDKCNPYLPPNTPSQPPVPIVPTSSPTPHPWVTLSNTLIPRRSPMPPIERAPFDVAVVLLLSHSTIVTAVAALSDAPDAVARNLAHIAADVSDVLRVTDAIMQIALCITQRIANDRSLVPGSRAQFGQALDPVIILRMLIDSDIRVRHAYGCAYAATQQRRGAASSLLEMRISLSLAHRARSMIRPGHRPRATRRMSRMPYRLRYETSWPSQPSCRYSSSGHGQQPPRTAPCRSIHHRRPWR